MTTSTDETQPQKTFSDEKINQLVFELYGLGEEEREARIKDTNENQTTGFCLYGLSEAPNGNRKGELIIFKSKILSADDD